MSRIKFIILYIIISIFGIQNVSAQENVEQYLKNKIISNTDILISRDNQKEIKADIYKYASEINIGDRYNNTFLLEKFIIKSKNNSKSYKSAVDLICSNEFVYALKKFKLKSLEDGVKLQSFIATLDPDGSRDGFFNIDSEWYFISNDFWGDVKAFRVYTTKNIIDSIRYEGELSVDMPENILGKNSKSNIETISNNSVSENLKKELEIIAFEKFSYKFDIKDNTSLTKICNNKVYDISLVTNDTLPQYTETSTYQFNIIENGNEFITYKSIKAFFLSDLFVQSISKDFRLKLQEDKSYFGNKFYEINSINKEKQLPIIQKDSIISYPYTDTWGDTLSLHVALNKGNSIKFIYLSGLSDYDLLKFRMNDPEYKLNFDFKLITPTKTQINHKLGTDLDIEISFNPEHANAKGTWIAEYYDGKNAGMYASTNLESPYKTKIDAEYLKAGEHTIQFYLMPNGKSDISKCYSEIIIKLNIQ